MSAVSSSSEAIISFSSTFAGVFLGFFLAFLYDRRRKRAEDERDRIRAIDAIRDEIERNMNEIPDDMKSVGQNLFTFRFFTTVAFDTAVNSGKLALLDNDLVGRVSEVYRIFRYCDAWSQKVLDTLEWMDPERDTGRARMADYQMVVYGYWMTLKRDVPDLLQRLREVSQPIANKAEGQATTSAK